MKIDDNTIITLSPDLLLSKQFLYALLEINEPEEQARLEAIAEIRAKDLGMESQFKKTLKAYHKADDALAAEYKKSNRQKTNIDLDFDGNGKPLSTINNFVQVLENDDYFSGLKYNLLTYSPEQERDGITYKWLDKDDAETRRYIEEKYKFHSQQKCEDALRIVFGKNEYHPVRDLIDSLEWDGISRIKQFLHTWTKCEDTPYTQEVSRLIFAGGIHRLYNPGCKFDDMPVLIGTKQGEGKSTLVRWLAMKDEYFTEVNDFDGQKGMEAVEGAWICEVSELLALTKQKEQEAVKSYLTRLNDRYRMPFDKRVTDHPRQCLFIGTTNKEQFLTDKTGNRRFYPIIVNQNGYELFKHEKEVKEYIKQCWAEAREKIFTDEMKPFANENLSSIYKEKQAEATEDDYRVGMIEDYLSEKTEVCILQLWRDALQMGDYSKPTKKDSNELALILQSMPDWEKQDKPRRFEGCGVQKWWKRAGSEDDLDYIL